MPVLVVGLVHSFECTTLFSASLSLWWMPASDSLWEKQEMSFTFTGSNKKSWKNSWLQQKIVYFKMPKLDILL